MFNTNSCCLIHTWDKIKYVNTIFPKCCNHVLWILLVSCILPLFAVAEVDEKFNIALEHWELKDGLPTWKISTITEDSRGIIWLATQEGAISFDGCTFKQYSPINHNVSAFNILRIFEDVHQNFWFVGESKGVVTIDVLLTNEEVIVPLSSYLQQPVSLDGLNHLNMVSHNGTIWLFGLARKIFKYDGKWQEFGILPSVEDGAYDDDYYYYPSVGDSYFGYSHGLNQINLFDNKGDLEKTFSIEGALYPLFPVLDKDMKLWITAKNKENQFIFYEISGTICITKKLDEIPFDKFTTNILTVSNVPYLTTDRILFSQLGSEYFVGSINNPFQKSLNDYVNDHQTNLIIKVFLDSQGNFWFNSSEGLFKLHIQKNPFKVFFKDFPLSHSLRGIAQLGDDIYINTYSGAYRMNANTKTIEPFVYPGNRMGIGSFVSGAYLFSSIHGKEILVHKKDGEQYIIPFDGGSGYVFLEGLNEVVLLGADKGLYTIFPSAKTIKPTQFNTTSVYALHRNKEGIWAGTPKGLYLLRENGEVIDSFLSPTTELSYRAIRYIFEASDGTFFLAAQGLGLIKWDRNTLQYSIFTPKDGLSHHTIHAIYEDQSGDLWLSSEQGLMLYRRRLGLIKTFYVEDGLPTNEFNYLSHFKENDGTLYFGTVDGLVAFHPDRIPKSSFFHPKLILTGVGTSNKTTGKYISKLQEAIDNKTIILEASERFVTLVVSPLIYKEYQNVEYAWNIDDSTDGWMIQTENTIRLNNLPYGENHLQIKARIIGNEWSDAVIDLIIVVEKPFYLKWWFFVLLFLLVGAVIWSFFRLRINYLQAQKKLLEREITKRTLQIQEDKRIIEEQANALKSLDHLKSNFFANVTHELKTPLTLVISPLQELLSKCDLPNFVKQKINYAIENAQRLQGLTEEILDLSKLEHNKLRLNEKDVALYPLLARIVAAYESYASFRNITLTFDFNLPLSLILLLDESKLEKIINNLLSNAMKFTSTGGSIQVKTTNTNQQIQIQVTDTGEGIHPEDLSYIFQRYFQSQRLNQNFQGGTGIGLALSKEYANLMQGDIQVESKWQSGSTFTLTFPMKLGTISEKLMKVTSEDTLKKSPERTLTFKLQQIQSILVVEDNFEMLSYIKEVLTTEYQVFQASNGKSAQEVLEKHTIDLIISDMMMPEVDGMQLLGVVKSHNKWNKIPFIMLTARDDVADKLSALRLGVDDYLKKPFIVAELAARVSNLLERASHRKKYIQEKVEEETSLSSDEVWLKELEDVVLLQLSNADFDVKKLAEALNISERTLRDRIKTHIGINPSQYIKEARLMRAQKLLETHQHQTVAEVAYSVGFDKPSYFAKIYKERFGKLPSDSFPFHT